MENQKMENLLGKILDEQEKNGYTHHGRLLMAEYAAAKKELCIEKQKAHTAACEKNGFTWKKKPIAPQETVPCPICGEEFRCEYDGNNCAFTIECDCAVDHSAAGWYQWQEPNGTQKEKKRHKNGLDI